EECQRRCQRPQAEHAEVPGRAPLLLGLVVVCVVMADMAGVVAEIMADVVAARSAVLTAQAKKARQELADHQCPAEAGTYHEQCDHASTSCLCRRSLCRRNSVKGSLCVR